MKNKIIKEIKLTIIYRQYESGARSLDYKRENAEPIEEWIAWNYLDELRFKKKGR